MKIEIKNGLSAVNFIKTLRPGDYLEITLSGKEKTEFIKITNIQGLEFEYFTIKLDTYGFFEYGPKKTMKYGELVGAKIGLDI